MDKNEILAKLSNLPEGELLAFLNKHEEKNSIPENPIEHSDINAFFQICYWDGKKTEYTSFEKFMNKVEALLRKTPYGVTTHQFYTDYETEVPYGNPEEALKLVRKTIIKCTMDANYNLMRGLHLFNKSGEIIWYLSYENDVTNNLENTMTTFMAAETKLPISKLKDYSDQYFVELIKTGLNYIRQHLFMKKEGVSDWDNSSSDPYGKAEREHNFKKLQAAYLGFHLAMKEKKNYSMAEKIIFAAEDILFARYKY